MTEVSYRRRCSTVLGATLAALIAAAGPAAAETGVTDTTIKLGQSAAYDGPAAALGTEMREGLLAAFKEVNAKGGVHGRTIELVGYDDGYEPDRAIANTNKLIDQDQVFALIGEVGTPTSQAVQPIATEKGVPFVGPFTGAGFLRDPKLRNVINIRGSYGAEAEAWIEYLTSKKGAKNIAILYQDDSFGRAGLDGVNKALAKRNMKLAAEGTYQRNTTAVKSALLDIRKADPDAVVMVGAYKPIAEFVKLAKKIKMDVPFLTISFVGSNALAKELGEDGKGVIISQVVPFPWNTGIPLVAYYQKAMTAHDAKAEPGFVSLEGYLVGRMMIAALDKAGKDVTRAGLLDAVYATGSFDLGGVVLTYGNGDNQGMDEVFMTMIEGPGKFVPLGAGS
jgi:branched-chain amino acid transport system substrate-binding protein